MDWLWYPVIGLGIWMAFKAGRQTERDEAIERRKKRQDEELALGALGPIAAMMVAGELTPEQADGEVRFTSMMIPLAGTMWTAMSQHERTDLGNNMIKLYGDAEFTAQQTKMAEELKPADPELWEAADKSLRIKMKINQAERNLGEPLDPLLHDIIALSVVDPEGHKEVMEALRAKAAEGTPTGGQG